jgi:hypothetical protein
MDKAGIHSRIFGHQLAQLFPLVRGETKVGLAFILPDLSFPRITREPVSRNRFINLKPNPILTENGRAGWL